MPLILPASAYAEWLDPRNEDVEQLDRLLRPEGAGEMIARPVGRAVSNARNEGARLIEPVVMRQPGLDLDSPPDGTEGD
jgi:putative SOS response-associated peptidase YedK